MQIVRQEKEDKKRAFKNIVLNTEFNEYLVEHPEVADKIPHNALVVILPDDDPALRRKNLPWLGAIGRKIKGSCKCE